MIKRAGIILIAIFFAESAIILLITGAALLMPHTGFDVIWGLNEKRRILLMPYREYLAPAFPALAALMAAASIGCFARRKWGLWLAVAIFIVNGLTYVAQIFASHVLEGIVGVAVAGAVIVYLTRPTVRAAFR